MGQVETFGCRCGHQVTLKAAAYMFVTATHDFNVGKLRRARGKKLPGATQHSLPLPIPWPLKLLNRFPILQALPVYASGVGVRPEHVRSAQGRH